MRQLASHGKNVVLVRDMTDTMYNSRSWPYVNHFDGTNRIVEHVEKYFCPTITTTDLTGQPAFRFQPDDRPRAVFVIGEDEYQTEKTLPAFANSELEPLGVRCTFVIADPKTPHDFKGIEALSDADLMVLSVRRRAPSAEQMSIIRKYLESSKPLVGIRTACHAFDARGQAPQGHKEWQTFDPDVLGGHYTGHHANELKPKVAPAKGAQGHPIMEGVVTPFTGQGSLYKTSPLAASAVPLLTGEIAGQPVEFVAWVNLVGAVAGLLHIAGPSRRLPEQRVSAAVAERGLLGAQSPSLQAKPPRLRQPHRDRRTRARPESAKGSGARSLVEPESPGPLSPQQALAAFHVPDDLRIDLVLCEPIIAQPVSLNFDERGRLWVVQYLQYPFPAGLKMVSHDNLWRTVYDKVPPPPPTMCAGRDRSPSMKTPTAMASSTNTPLSSMG